MTDIPTPDVVALVRRRYVEGAPLRAINAESGLRNTVLYRCLAGEFDDGSGVQPTPIVRRRPAARMARTNGRAALVARLWRAAEGQVKQIESRMKAIGLHSTEREGDARTLAIVVKTLRDLAAFDEAQTARNSKPADNADNDDPVPKDMDEFRRELARRIDALVDSRSGSRIPDDNAH